MHAGFSLLVVDGLHRTYAQYLAGKMRVVPSTTAASDEQPAEDEPMLEAPPIPADVVMMDVNVQQQGKSKSESESEDESGSEDSLDDDYQT